ncbi:uncharacterized protein PFL1_01468 [Pseudozyma flocculosa PF-1]|uniref:uncharacterized protein n=1 Tax=Pseudozyma flocculosa PF-1 TaxID=1277687 RepID=UPI0004561B6C|nr:uncharacterized protein PFL1_01468 [Pseudozyma flocculosa PF-1]EPQ31283.1 hypothetical protein PFL1_01468 [Pseudozyma flocculosa PF-1]
MLSHRRVGLRLALVALSLLLLSITMLQIARCRPMDDGSMVGATSEALEALYRALDQEEAESLGTVAHSFQPHSQVEPFGPIPRFVHPTAFTTMNAVIGYEDLEKASVEERNLVLQKYTDDFVYGPASGIHWDEAANEFVPFRFRDDVRIKRHTEFLIRRRGTDLTKPARPGPLLEYIVNNFLVRYIPDLASSNAQFKAYYVIAVPLDEVMRPRNSNGAPILYGRIKEVGELEVPTGRRRRA